MVRIANPNVQTLDKVRSLHNKSKRIWVGILTLLHHQIARWMKKGSDALLQGRPPPRLQKVCQFQVPKWTLWTNRKITQCGNTSPVHCQILKRANVQLCQRRKQNLYSFLFTLPKSCTIALWFFSRKWPHCYSIRSALLATVCATISQIWACSPAAPPHDSAK